MKLREYEAPLVHLEQTLNGITFLFSFSFDANNVTVSNTCIGSLNATVQSPVLYKYTARVTKSDRKETTKGSDSCIAEMRAGTLEFEVKSGKLHVTYNGQKLISDPAGSVAGLYGQWQKISPEFGTLKWSMGGGKFRVISECNIGLTASVEVPAETPDWLHPLVLTIGWGLAVAATCPLALLPPIILLLDDATRLVKWPLKFFRRVKQTEPQVALATETATVDEESSKS